MVSAHMRSAKTFCQWWKNIFRERWDTVDTFLHFQSLLLYFKSKQAQHLSHNKATRYTQYIAKSWKQLPSEKILQSIWKGCFFCQKCPMPGAQSTWAWGTPDGSIKSWVAWIATCSRDIPYEIGTSWLPLYFFHILISHYHCMAKQICMITKHETNAVCWNSCFAIQIQCVSKHIINLKILIVYKYSVMHSKITSQALPCLDWPGDNVLSVPHFLSDLPHAYLKNKMKK